MKLQPSRETLDKYKESLRGASEEELADYSDLVDGFNFGMNSLRKAVYILCGAEELLKALAAKEILLERQKEKGLATKLNN